MSSVKTSFPMASPLPAEAEEIVGRALEPYEPPRIVFEDDLVSLNGQVVRPRTTHHHYILNKPKGVTTTTKDPRGKRDLSEYLRNLPAGVYPVGRLDRETTGLLLLQRGTTRMRPNASASSARAAW